MTGSVKPEAYPGPSAQVWANRAVSEKAQASAQKKGYNELKDATMSKKQQELMAKKEAKALAEAKFKADQEKRRAKEAAERAVRKDVRGQSLATIEGERQKARAEARMKEENDAAMARLRIAEQNSGMQFEDQVEAVIDAGDSEFQAQVAKTALAQRKMQEENDARHEAEAKAEREAKAAAKESADKQKRDDEMKRQRDEAYRIKKEMAAETRRQKERQEQEEAAIKKRRQAERKKNDEYDKWLGKGDILRDEMELMNERREGSSMSKGAKFSGIPDTKVDGKGNQ